MAIAAATTTPKTSKNSSKNKAAAPPLPLGWTQVTRKDTRGGDSNCIKNEAHQRNKKRLQRIINRSNSNNTNSSSSVIENNNPAKPQEQPKNGNTNEYIHLKGKALFCLHEIDCTWFQGHFILDGTNGVKSLANKSLGLLAVQREMDACMECLDGGYRELDLTIIRHKPQRRKSIVPCVSTGGDMIRLRSDDGRFAAGAEGNSNEQQLLLGRNAANSISRGGSATNGIHSAQFDADRVLTGVEALKMLQSYFQPLLRRVSIGSNNNNSSRELSADELSELLPDCAVVVGSMMIQASRRFLGVDQQVATEGHGVNDEWMDGE